jgi:hypothetical protein
VITAPFVFGKGCWCYFRVVERVYLIFRAASSFFSFLFKKKRNDFLLYARTDCSTMETRKKGCPRCGKSGKKCQLDGDESPQLFFSFFLKKERKCKVKTQDQYAVRAHGGIVRTSISFDNFFFFFGAIF